MKSRQKIVRNIVYYGLRAALWLARRVPFGPGLWFSGFLGGLVFHILPYERGLCLEHLDLAFGDSLSAAEKRRIARHSFRNFGFGLFELINFEKIRPRLAEYMRLEGVENLDLALAEGRGCVLITGHCGNWELFACSAALAGYPVSVVARKIYDERINELMIDFRSSYGIYTILRENSRAMREILEVFNKNRLLAILIDQDTRVQGVFVDFFGKKAYTPAGPALLALKRDAPVIAGFNARGPDGKYTAYIGPPFHLENTGDKERDVLVGTQRLTRLIEDFIRQHPEGWVWMHRRWKTRPVEEAHGRPAPEEREITESVDEQA